MTTTSHRSTITAFALAAAATVVLLGPAPSAHATRPGSDGSASSTTHDPIDIGLVVAHRRAEQAQYLVTHRLLDLR
jgi:hypothetical protein